MMAHVFLNINGVIENVIAPRLLMNFIVQIIQIVVHVHPLNLNAQILFVFHLNFYVMEMMTAVTEVTKQTINVEVQHVNRPFASVVLIPASVLIFFSFVMASMIAVEMISLMNI
jgi:hypothetical protein